MESALERVEEKGEKRSDGKWVSEGVSGEREVER